MDSSKPSARTIEAFDHPSDRRIPSTHHEQDYPVIEPNPEKAQKLSTATVLAIFFLGLSVVPCISLGFLVVSAVLVQIGTLLDDTTHTTWVVAGFSIASALAFTVAGRLSDIFGRRYVILTGQLLSIVGVIIGAVAQKTTTVVACGTILGFGSGLILTIYAAIPELCPRKYRGLGLAWIEGCIMIPWGTLSVLLGNNLVEHASWRWIYYIGIIYGVISMAGTIIFYFPPSRPRHDEEKTRWDQIKELDFIGLLLYSAGLTIALVGLAWAGQPGHAWKSASVIAPIVVGVVVICCCFFYDWVIIDQNRALFPVRLFKKYREYTVSLFVIFVAGTIFYSMAVILPQATLYVFTNNHNEIGLIQLPNGFGQTVGAVVGPAILHKTKNIKAHIICALTIQTLFVGLYAYTLPSHKAAWMAFQFFGQGCFSWLTVCCIMNAGLHVQHMDLGLATGVIGSFRSAGGSVGTTVFTTILNSVKTQQLGPRIARAALEHGFNKRDLPLLISASVKAAAGVPHAYAKVPGVTPVIEAAVSKALKEAYAYAFKRVFYATIPFGVLAIIAAVAIKDAGQYMTNHTDVALEKDVLHHGTPTEKGEDVGA